MKEEAERIRLENQALMKKEKAEALAKTKTTNDSEEAAKPKLTEGR